MCVGRNPIYTQYGIILTRDSPHPTPTHRSAAAQEPGGRHGVGGGTLTPGFDDKK